MKILKFTKTQRAMTLVEIIVSISLVTLLGGVVFGLLIQNMKMGETIDCNYAAVNIAKSRIDRIREFRRDYGFTNLQAVASSTNISLNRDGGDSGDLDFLRSTTITTNFDGNSSLIKVEVSVSYKGTGDVSTTTITLTSLISPYF